ncbi:CvpA family protein [Peribacillus asahii]|uniref:Membrane protein n=1 Tax=Peribacillus asahii TaxID=228899 RepID=A0A3T0KWE6_9BACI|nr:CvpA family protein [Peribacillus asahii]AZV44647.1 membrane protein [Peribacillus asahii]USK84315.1 CvpA family protein [Peribacillus asahii]
MFDLAILAILLIGLLIGLRRGFILQIIHLTGFIVAFIVAYVYYDELAPKLNLWVPFPAMGDSSTLKMFFDTVGLDTAYYNAIAFAIIFFITKIVWHMIGAMLDFIAHLPILKQLNRWGGGILGFMEVYLILFIILYIVALLPMDAVQEPLNGSFLAEAIVRDTPFLSNQVEKLWFYNVPS